MSNENLALWNAFCETDPKYTSEVTSRGGFTAICAQYQKKNATKAFGPYGKSWGLKDITVGYVGPPEDPTEIYMEAWFFYPDGQFWMTNDMPWKKGAECRKRLQTDLLTKSLSMLGFNSDVFENKFSDSMYRDQLHAKYEKERIYAAQDEKTKETIAKVEGMRSELTGDNETISKYMKNIAAREAEFGKAGVTTVVALLKSMRGDDKPPAEEDLGGVAE